MNEMETDLDLNYMSRNSTMMLIYISRRRKNMLPGRSSRILLSAVGQV
jgi:hypothetical protein